MKIAVLVSGGVDSSVVLARLAEQGHELTAFYLKIWLEDELSFLGDCPWEEDLAFVRAVCEQFSVPLEVVPMQKEYHERIVSYTVSQARAGCTPSPDVLCNQYIKFGAFFDYLQASGRVFDKVATGHYAQVVQRGERYHLLMAPDPVKDQTYFLAQLSQAQLAQALFPIGDLTKQEVRALAQRYQLPNRDRKDSQGICFLGKISFNEFLAHYLGTAPGPIIEEETGTVLGTHQGYWFHTVGQRKGLGLSGGPWYVSRKECQSNTVYVSRHYYDADKERKVFSTLPVHWIAGVRPEQTEFEIKVRHGAHRHHAQVALRADGSAVVQLAERDQGLAPGQFAVFYLGTECLGCGVIAS